MNADYFIKKFEAIPDEKWCVGTYEDNEGRKCVLGHCGHSLYKLNDEREYIEIKALFAKTFAFMKPNHINDGTSETRIKFPQTTPKARILAALRIIKQYEKAYDWK